VCSNLIWKDHTLTATFRQPFDLLVITNTTWQRKKAAWTIPPAYVKSWLPTVDNLRCAKQSLVFLIGCKSQLSKV
jgi:hypothetical protein